MNRKLAVSVACAAWVAVTSGACLRAVAGDELAVLVPARERVVKLGFDIAALRQAVLITYQVNPADGQPVLHRWDVKGKAWQPLGLDAYAFGQFFTSGGGSVYLIGSDAELPALLVTGAEQLGAKVYRIETLDVANALNRLNATLKFSWREWRALSERHGLQVEDKNLARRKWGRYGPPKRKVEPPAAALPAAPVAESEGEAPTDTLPADPVTASQGELPAAALPKATVPENETVDAATPPREAPPRARVVEAPLPMVKIEPAEAAPEMEPPADEK
jgi:hypothetical protein